jgi:hypothetical protein
MIPIKQTVNTETDGNCVAASLASILENNINDYPTLPNNKDWYPVLNKYLNTLGYNLVLVENLPAFCLKGYHLIIGMTKCDKKHCIVGKSGLPFHDPSPFIEKAYELKDPYYGVISKIFS